MYCLNCTLQVVVDLLIIVQHTTCNPLVVRSLDFVQTSAHVQKRTQLSKLICGVQYILKQKPYS